MSLKTGIQGINITKEDYNKVVKMRWTWWRLVPYVFDIFWPLIIVLTFTQPTNIYLNASNAYTILHLTTFMLNSMKRSLTLENRIKVVSSKDVHVSENHLNPYWSLKLYEILWLSMSWLYIIVARFDPFPEIKIFNLK